MTSFIVVAFVEEVRERDVPTLFRRLSELGVQPTLLSNRCTTAPFQNYSESCKPSTNLNVEVSKKEVNGCLQNITNGVQIVISNNPVTIQDAVARGDLGLLLLSYQDLSSENASVINQRSNLLSTTLFDIWSTSQQRPTYVASTVSAALNFIECNNNAFSKKLQFKKNLHNTANNSVWNRELDSFSIEVEQKFTVQDRTEQCLIKLFVEAGGKVLSRRTFTDIYHDVTIACSDKFKKKQGNQICMNDYWLRKRGMSYENS